MQVTIPTEVAIHIKKAGQAFTIPVGTYAANVNESIFVTGLGRIVNDLVASAKTEAEAVAAVNKKLDAWARGEVRAARESDPVASEAKKIAMNRIVSSEQFKAWMAKEGVKPTDPRYAAAIMKNLATVQAREDVQALAKQAVEARAAIEVELDF